MKRFMKAFAIACLLTFPLLSNGQNFDKKQLLGSWEAVNNDPQVKSKDTWVFKADSVTIISKSESNGSPSTFTMKESYTFDGQCVKLNLFGMNTIITIKELTSTNMSGTLKAGEDFTKEVSFLKPKE